MSLLDTPTGQALLDEATLSANDMAGCGGRLAAFLERCLPLFYRNVTVGTSQFLQLPALGIVQRPLETVDFAAPESHRRHRRHERHRVKHCVSCELGSVPRR